MAAKVNLKKIEAFVETFVEFIKKYGDEDIDEFYALLNALKRQYTGKEIKTTQVSSNKPEPVGVSRAAAILDNYKPKVPTNVNESLNIVHVDDNGNETQIDNSVLMQAISKFGK